MLSEYWLKTILAGFLLLAGLAASWTMLTVMGAPEKGRDPARLRKFHRVFGYAFGLLLAVLAVLGAEFFVEGGDQLSLRAVLHGFLAVSLLFIFLFKVALVRFYRHFLRLAPTLGMTLLILTLVVYSVSAGYYILRSVAGPEPTPVAYESSGLAGDSGAGAELYARQCGSCHYADRPEAKAGPGLKGVLARDKLPFSGKPATEENVRHQLLRPADRMPAFAFLSEREIADLIAYLKTL